MARYAQDYTQAVTIYCDELRKCKPINAAKEKKLVKLARKGNANAKNELISSNLRFVFDIAKRYAGKGVPMGDLISEGNIGLIKALDRFDENKGYRFITYAVWWIKQSIIEAIRINKGKIRLSDISYPNDEDEMLNNEEKIFTDENSNPVYNQPVPSCSYENEAMELEERQNDVIDNVLDSLNTREREIIEAYFGINGKSGKLLTEIGNELNLTSERIRQIKEKAIRKLRSKMLILTVEKEELY